VQLLGGHRQRQYCDDNCRQDAFRRRQEEKRREDIRQRWAGFTLETQGYLAFLMSHYGEELASSVALTIAREIADHQQHKGTDEQFMAEGKRLGFPELHFPAGKNAQGVIRRGEEAWSRFSQGGELRLVKIALEVARAIVTRQVSNDRNDS
jgi:hypothetical protein